MQGIPPRLSTRRHFTKRERVTIGWACNHMRRGEPHPTFHCRGDGGPLDSRTFFLGATPLMNHRLQAQLQPSNNHRQARRTPPRSEPARQQIDIHDPKPTTAQSITNTASGKLEGPFPQPSCTTQQRRDGDA